jgi:hypothetical protein
MAATLPELAPASLAALIAGSVFAGSAIKVALVLRDRRQHAAALTAANAAR